MKWIVCLLALSAVSCGIAEVVEPAGGGGASGVPEPSDGKYPVEINLGETTRLTGDGTAWTDGDYIGVSVDGVAGQTIFRYNGTTGAWEGGYSATGFVSRLYWPDEKTRTVTAWYPWNDADSNFDTFVLRGTGSGNYKTPANIQMEHQLALVRFNIIADPVYAANSMVYPCHYSYSYSRGVITGRNTLGQASRKSGGMIQYAPGDFTVGWRMDDNYLSINIIDQSGTRVGSTRYYPTIKTVEAGKFYDIDIPIKQYAVGDVYYNAAGAAIGVVCEITNGGFSGTIMSLDEIRTDVWAPVNGDTSMTYGLSNMGAIQRADADFSEAPPFKWAAAKNTTAQDYAGGFGNPDYSETTFVWYLPAANELKDVYDNYVVIEQALARTAGATPLQRWGEGIMSSVHGSSSYDFQYEFVYVYTRDSRYENGVLEVDYYRMDYYPGDDFMGDIQYRAMMRF